MCRQKDAKTVQGCALKTRSPCCAGYEFIFRLPPKNKSVLHADGLKKSLRRIFIAPALECGRANHHPLSPPRRRGTMGRVNKYIKVGGLRFLQALTPRERCSRFIVTNPSGPLSRHRERGWGERADTPVATLGAILCAVRIDFGLPSKINPYPAQPATGVLGQSPKRVLVPFTRVKGTPRRRAVLIMFFIKLAPPKVTTNQPRRQAYRLEPFVKLAPPIGE